MSTKPTVGRVVLYTPGEGTGKRTPYPAIITEVRESGLVNLAVFGDGDFPLGRDDQFPIAVAIGQPGQPATWCWPTRVDESGLDGLRPLEQQIDADASREPTAESQQPPAQ